MGISLAERYYLVSAEAEGQDMMEMIGSMAAMMGKGADEMMCLRFPGGNKVTVTINGEATDTEFTEDGNRLNVDVLGNEMQLVVGDGTITLDMGGTVMVFGDSPPAGDGGEEGGGGSVSYELDGVKVTLELPEKGWCSECGMEVFSRPVLSVYNLPTVKRKGMINSAITISAQKRASDFDVPGNPDFEKNRIGITGRAIGGIDMVGRVWGSPVGMYKAKYTEYIGAFNDSCCVCVTVGDVTPGDGAADMPNLVAPVRIDVGSAEVQAILDSIRFE